MGLDTTHDCWHGAYSAFMRWRETLARIAGYPPLRLMEGFYRLGEWDDPVARLEEKGYQFLADSLRGSLPISWEMFRDDPLITLLNHSDCEGEIAASDCGAIANRLQELVPKLPQGDAPGHIGDWRDKTEAFINGLRDAAQAGEPVEFH